MSKFLVLGPANALYAARKNSLKLLFSRFFLFYAYIGQTRRKNLEGFFIRGLVGHGGGRVMQHEF